MASRPSPISPNKAPLRRWAVVGAAIAGMSTGPGQFAFGSLSLFIIPLGKEFGWDRAEISVASTIFTVTLMLSLPFLGRLVDRYGSRRILLPSMLIVALLLASNAYFVEELWHFWLVFALIGCLGAGANSLPYMRTVSAWFDRRRGLALGITLAGAGLGYSYVPPAVQAVIASHGWRAAYYLLAAIILFIALPLIALFFRESPGERASSAPSVSSEATLPGMERPAALRMPVFWQLFAVFGLLSCALYGLMLHSVPMLIDRGMSATAAALAASTIGVTIMISRVIVGYLIDRIFAPVVAAIAFGLSAVGLIVLAVGAVDVAAFIAMILIGFSIGAEIDLLTFLTTRYFGLRHFGAIYGLLFVSFLIGTSSGPLLFGWAYERAGSYTLVLWVAAALVLAATLITRTLPQYARFESSGENHA
ncbi:MAG: MFS transporter [Gammaproteobacteria bacterium]|nr:MFS transporter [Gammaproteobacteria bacterium]